MRKFLAFSAVAEVGVALAMLIDPALVVRWLLGVEIAAPGTLLGRFFGIALLALEVACWPNPTRAEGRASAFHALLIYNVLFALYLAYLGTASNLGGWLLWPAVAFHAAVALLLGSSWRDQRRIEPTHP